VSSLTSAVLVIIDSLFQSILQHYKLAVAIEMSEVPT
jgi:hypothetical protein